MINTLLVAASLALPGQVFKADLSDSLLLKNRLSEVIVETQVPAIGAVVVRNGKLEAAAFAGVRRKGKTAKVTANDLWQLGSVTKVFTKELVRKAVTENKTAWNKTLAQALPTFANKMHADVKGLTLQQVADHQSGLANSHEGTPWLFPKLPTLSLTRQNHVRMALGLKPPKAPGESNYSNFGYVVLGVLAEQLYGKPYENALRDKLLTPWGVSWVFFGEPSLILPNQPWPHTSAGPLVMPVASCKNSLPFNTYAPAGHLSVSVAQADELMLGYMNGGGPTKGHNGSNGRNYARIQMDTQKKYAYLIVTNCGGDAAVKAATAVEEWIKKRIPKP
jgi:CubicO group peptidase (beta-lactamase class C family)